MPPVTNVRLSAPLLLASLACATPQAATFTVGGEASCTHATVQAAINAAQGGAHIVRVTRSATYTAQALTITTDGTMEVAGGFANCSAASDGTRTTLSGAGGATEPVLRITVATGGSVTLRHLTITAGDEDGAGYGGGIFFRGNGVLELVESTVSNNLAGYGGGIYAEGTGTAAELVLGTGVSVVNNTARLSGGGVYVEGMEMSMTAPGSILAFNKALGIDGTSGFGGGLMLLGGPFTTYAYVGSDGQGGLGAIYGNEAVHGGGIGVVSEPDGERDAILELSGNGPAVATAIRGNFASASGGAIYALSDNAAFPARFSDALVSATYAALEDNAAPAGAAVHLDNGGSVFGDSGSQMDFLGGRIRGNRATDGNGQPTQGAVLLVGIDGDMSLRDTSLLDNHGGRLLDVDGELASASVDTSQVTGNTASLELLRSNTGGGGLSAGSFLSIEDTTIAGNDIGAGVVIHNAGSLALQRSIVWQPGRTIVRQDGSLVAADMLASETGSLDDGPDILLATPRFLDPARGDYRLRAASHAIDFAPAFAGDDRDLDGNPRDTDLSRVANFRGPRDLGAFERPLIQPLVLNGLLDVDLNLWTVATAGAVAWSSENSRGSDGGSALVAMNPAPSAEVVALTQCIHLPGPGEYFLNGWGKAVGLTQASRDKLYLQWQFRSDGGEACTDGAPQREDNHFLTSSSTWTQPAAPAWIVVSDAEWTHNSSISVSLRVVDTGVTSPSSVMGYFDDIRLGIGQLAAGELLKDGFEGP